MTVSNGKPVVRVMDPEEVNVTCLVCHGGPKDEYDVSRRKNVGLKEAELARVNNVLLPLR